MNIPDSSFQARKALKEINEALIDLLSETNIVQKTLNRLGANRLTIMNIPDSSFQARKALKEINEALIDLLSSI